MRILVVESRSEISVPLVNYLEELRHCVDFASDQALAVYLTSNSRFDAIVLAERLAEGSGLRALRSLRELMRKPIPVLMLGAQGSEPPAVGDGEGPDGYLAPSYSLETITGRLGILRRRKGKTRTMLQVGEVTFDVAAQAVRRKGQLLRIESPLLPMLQALMEASPKRVSFRELGSCLLDEQAPVAEARVRVRMRSLREALDRPFTAPMIRNRRDGFCILAADQGDQENDSADGDDDSRRRAGLPGRRSETPLSH